MSETAKTPAAKPTPKKAAAAKVGVHYVPFSPHDRAGTEVSVTRVRGGTVYVRPHSGPDAGAEISLNEAASKKLLDGDYRAKPQPAAPAAEPAPAEQAPSPATEPSTKG